MYTITAEKYGFGEYEYLSDIINKLSDLDDVTFQVWSVQCSCGEYIYILCDSNGDIVAVDTEHVHHKAW
jgi:hypothetical protein